MEKIYKHDGNLYRMIERNAEFGEKVLAVEYESDDTGIKPGDVLMCESEGFGDGSITVANGRGFFDTDIGDKYFVLELIESEASPSVIDLLANLARRVSSLEQQLSATQSNVEKLAEELANTKHRVSKHAARFGYVEDEFVRLTDDILTLDERSQVLNAINKFYEEGNR
jgi:hypothetical protein